MLSLSNQLATILHRQHSTKLSCSYLHTPLLLSSKLLATTMRITSSAVAVLSTSLALVSCSPAEGISARGITCNPGRSTKDQIREAMRDIDTSKVYGFNPPNNNDDFVNCLVQSTNGIGGFCCQVSKRGEHNAAIALVMNNLHGRCPSAGRTFSGQNIIDNMNDLLRTCNANPFAGIKDLTGCITLRVGHTGC